MTPLATILADEIASNGPIPFSRFMEQALYHSEHGYYRRDRFGVAGDFYTAEQIQPVFGRVAAEWIRTCARELGMARPLVVELGAGRREMADAFSEFDYCPVDVDGGSLPARFSGIVFSNEFFDAIPVDVVARSGDRTVERRVAFDGSRFTWVDGPEVPMSLPDGVDILELQHQRVLWMERIAHSLEAGFVISVDYGFTTRELTRFPQGTLMSYRSHTASDSVLVRPGAQDITAHVDFTALNLAGADAGLATVRLESLAAAILRAGETDNFARALSAPDEKEALRLRMQLKTLLFGMGETFRVLTQRKGHK